MTDPGTSLNMDDAAKLLRENWDVTLFDKVRLAPGVAELLAKHPGPLDLYSLKELSAADARSLAQHQGRLHLRDLDSPSTEVLQALARHVGPLLLPRVRELGETEAEALGHHAGLLSLEGVHHLPAAPAALLAKHQGPLHLNGVSSLSLATAKAVSLHRGPLYLFEVSHVSDEVAEALETHRGPVGIFPLAQMSERARAILREQRRRTCEQESLPPRSEFEKLGGTFQPVQLGMRNEWSFIYYPRLPHPDPVLLRIYWRSDWIKGADKTLPAQLPDWFVALLPKIGECIEQLCLEPLPYGDPIAFILDAGIEITNEKLHAMYIQCVDSEALYWEIVVDVEAFPSEFRVDCYGGAHLQGSDYLTHIPLNHSIHDTTLERLKWWQRSASAPANEKAVGQESSPSAHTSHEN